MQEWATVCGRYLPLADGDAKWRLSREVRPDDPEQGWKLHLSATLLTAVEILGRIGPFLLEQDALFKGPASLSEVCKINSGIVYGYTQVGKIFTIYPQDIDQAVMFARRLHELSAGMPAPAVPFDRRFRPGSCLYYRYGAFKSIEITSSAGNHAPAIRTPEGDLMPDSRESWETDFGWLSDPFRVESPPEAPQPENPLTTSYWVFRALKQRGRGGVYQAIDLSGERPKLCIVKEGRRNGETGPDGRDGFDRAKREAESLIRLREAGIPAPRLEASFEANGHYYLVLECIAGESLQELLSRRRRRLRVEQALDIAIRVAKLIAQLHDAGWAWRDCKPGNLIVTTRGEARPIDFEGACLCDQPDPLPWRTPGYSPPESVDGAPGGVTDDFYAIGAILYLLLTGRAPSASHPNPASKYRPGLPADLMRLIDEMLSPDPRQRPRADEAAAQLTSFLKVERRPSGRKMGALKQLAVSGV